MEVGHGSIEPDNSGGTVDIEGFFLRYGDNEPPLPIQRGREHCNGGVKEPTAVPDIVKDNRKPRSARTLRGTTPYPRGLEGAGIGRRDASCQRTTSS